MKKDSIFREYWYLWAVVILLPIVLYFIIQQPCGFDAIGGAEAPKVWLGFWGGYIGAIISASVAFFILDKQIKTNKKENEANRTANETQNEVNRIANEEQNAANRAIQLKTAEYQQKLQWLNDFKKVSAEYIAVFNNNNLVVAQNDLRDNPERAYNTTRAILDNLQMTKAKMDLFKETDEYANALCAQLSALYDRFSAVVIDIHKLSSLMIAYNDPNNLLDPFAMQNFIIENIRSPKNGFSEEIKALILPDAVGLDEDQMRTFAKQRRESVDKILKDVSSLLVAYTTEEQKRINDILL